MHADIFDEKSRPGLPTMPRVDEKMPHRGLVDQFEVLVRGDEVHLKGDEVHLKGDEVHLKGDEVHR